MRFNKFVGTMAAATISLAAMTGTANAQQVTFASINSIQGQTVFSYQENGAFTVTGGMFFEGNRNFPTTQPNQLVNVTFTGFADSGNAMFTALSPTTSFGTQALGGGSFTITSQAAPGTVLLTGTFGESSLSGVVGSGATTGGVATNFNSVNYTGGTFFTEAGLINPGAFSFNLTSITTGGVGGLFANASGTSFQSFVASGGATFSATSPNPIPEPSEWLAMGMAATSVGGLMFRAKLKLRAKRQVEMAA